MTGVLFGVMSGKQKISEIQRYLKNHFDKLCKCLKYEARRPISDPQLRRLLNQVDWKKYNEINESCFGVYMDYETADWISIDGKELRGSIEKLNPDKRRTRGEVMINVVRHKDGRVLKQDFYRGDKKSEREAVCNVLKDNKLCDASITLDALHCLAGTTKLINDNGGRYIVQLKSNQRNLVKQMKQKSDQEAPCFKVNEIDRSHGRITERRYSFYDISKLNYASRWSSSNFESLIKVDRKMTNLRSKRMQSESAFYLSNTKIESNEKSVELARAVRGHWTVEADHYIRDVTFGEDQVRMPKGNANRTLAIIRTWAIQLLKMTNTKNIKAQMQLFADCPDQFYKYLINMDLRT